ncbi:Histidine phosphatase superfamily, clade-2 like protein [Aduncisulcus paluster]|uniref:Histidine phosphatase superfamily, clade-2 like protein n=1 Tax=Aduncisulcus paluster TaxID=2918883 RepID=A0ABQ5KB40_9EUKA|nr:Histidine phosphatase superfamily, clade-2 like protein [Aduncisulcus paluster]
MIHFNLFFIFVFIISIQFSLSLQFDPTNYIPIYASYVFRHGDRTALWPLDPAYETDEWDNMVGNRSTGQLTQMGLQQAYSKGKTFYNNLSNQDDTSLNLLPTSYNFSTVQFRATGVDRTLMTGYGILASIFDGNDSAAIPNNSQPVPIHAVLKTDDSLLRPYDMCQKLEDLHNSLDDIPDLWAEYEQRKDILDEISDKIGTDCTGPSTVQSALYDPLTCDHSHGYLPMDVTEDEYSQVVDMFNIVESYEFSTASPYYQLYSCNFLQELYSHIETLFVDEAPTADAHFYFAHDSTLMAFRAGLGITPEKVPEYVAHLGYEVLRQSTTPFRPSWVTDRVSMKGTNMADFYIRLVFGDNSDSYDGITFSSPFIDEYVKSLGGAGETLPEGYYRLDHFMQYIETQVWDEDKFNEQCGNLEDNEGMKWYWGFIIGIAIAGVVISAGFFIRHCIEQKKYAKMDNYFKLSRGSVDGIMHDQSAHEDISPLVE